MRRSRGREFAYEAVAPAVPGVEERLHNGGELSLATVVHRDRVDFRIADPDLDPLARLDVARPVGALPLGDKVKAPAMLGEQISISRA